MKSASFILLGLNGPSQSGKTQTIKLVAQKLLASGWRSVYRAKKWVEVLEVFESHGVRVGVSSRSDKFPILAEGVEALLNEQGCHLVVFAANRQTKGVDAFLEGKKAEGGLLDWLEKAPAYVNRSERSQHQRLNEAAAAALYHRIAGLLSEPASISHPDSFSTDL